MEKNPLKLKRKTHILAEKHLGRFAADQRDARLFVYYKPRKKIVKIRPSTEGLFNVDGVWSEQAEHHITKVERKFWAMLDAEIVDQEIASDYFAFWYARVKYVQSRSYFEQPLPGITPSDLSGKVDVNLNGEIVTATKEDVLEFQGVGYYTKDAHASARSSSWPVILWFADVVRMRLREEGFFWHYVSCEGASLVLPDFINSADIPISPNLLLHGHKKDSGPHVDIIQARQIEELNRCFFNDAIAAVAAHSDEVLRSLADL